MQHHHNRSRPPRIELQPGHVAFRVVCHKSLVSGLIGSSGSVISRIRRDTSCLIHCGELVHGSDHCAILVMGPGAPERRITLNGDAAKEEVVSAAQEAVLKILERMWELESQSQRGSVGGGGNVDENAESEGYCGLLANTTQIGAVVGRGGKHIIGMRKYSGAHIRILPAPLCSAKDDELIQITGGTLAVKKAVIAVTSCLQDCPAFPKDQKVLPRPVEPPERGARTDPHAELFPHLSSLLPPLTENPPSSTAADVDSNDDSRATRREVSFRLLCSNGAAGSIIGKRGAIVRALQNQTGASVVFASPITMSSERIVTVSASENQKLSYSPAQNAIVLVFARSVEYDIENGRPSGLNKGTSVTAKLLVESDVLFCLGGNGERIDSEMMRVTGAEICILEREQVLSSSWSDVVVQIRGEYKNVQNAIFQVTSRLRELLWNDVSKEVRVRDPYGIERDITSPRSQLSAGLCLDSDQELNMKRGMDRLGFSGHKSDPVPTQLHSPQKLGRDYTSKGNDNESNLANFVGGSELERSLHFLLPRDVLNEVGARSSSGEVRETTSSGSYLSLGLSSDSSVGTLSKQENYQIGLSNSINGDSSAGLQPLQTAGRETTIANPDTEKRSTAHGRSGNPESRKRSAIVANTTLELIVSDDLISFIYGEGGSNLERLRQISGAKIEVRDPSPGKSEGMVVISGTPDQTRIAETLIQAFILDS